MPRIFQTACTVWGLGWIITSKGFPVAERCSCSMDDTLWHKLDLSLKAPEKPSKTHLSHSFLDRRPVFQTNKTLIPALFQLLWEGELYLGQWGVTVVIALSLLTAYQGLQSILILPILILSKSKGLETLLARNAILDTRLDNSAPVLSLLQSYSIFVVFLPVQHVFESSKIWVFSWRADNFNRWCLNNTECYILRSSAEKGFPESYRKCAAQPIPTQNCRFHRPLEGSTLPKKLSFD